MPGASCLNATIHRTASHPPTLTFGHRLRQIHPKLGTSTPVPGGMSLQDWIIWINPPRTTRPATMPQVRGLNTSFPIPLFSDCSCYLSQTCLVSFLLVFYSDVVFSWSFSIQTQMRSSRGLSTITTTAQQPDIASTRHCCAEATDHSVSERL